MRRKDEFVPKRRNKFIAVERATGRKALIGGICTCLRWQKAKTGRCEFVEGINWNNQERFFHGSKWRFLRRK